MPTLETRHWCTGLIRFTANTNQSAATYVKSHRFHSRTSQPCTCSPARCAERVVAGWRGTRLSLSWACRYIPHK